jgi:hypothetical protein
MHSAARCCLDLMRSNGCEVTDLVLAASVARL